jgi:hypothetical protein
MFYHNPGRNTMTDTSSSSADASAAPHTGNPTSDVEDSPKAVVRAASTTGLRHHLPKTGGGFWPDADNPARLGKSLDTPGRLGLLLREDNKIEATRTETSAGQTQLRNVLTTVQFSSGTREQITRNS